MTGALIVARRFTTERRLLIFGVAGGAMLTLVLQLAMYSSVRDTFADMSENLPEAFTRLVGSSDFASPEGFLQAEAFGTMAPILVILVAISTAASSIPGTERAGRMDLLATSSLSRRAIAAGAALSVSIALTVVVFVYWVTILIGSTIGGFDIGVEELTAASLALWLLGLAVGGVAFAVGAASGRRGAAVGTAASVAVGSFLAYGLLPLSDSFAWGRFFSLWYPYADHQPLSHGMDVSNMLVLAAVGAVGLVVGVWGFEHRDLG